MCVMKPRASKAITRVQVLLEEGDKELFLYRARLEGLSLSAWLLRAGKEKLKEKEGAMKLENQEDLASFFAACDAREVGREPDWEDHLAVIERSKRAGIAEN